MESCVFCQIVKGVAPASVVYSDEKTMALMDIQPVNQGHTLTVPKVHSAHLSDLDEENGSHMFKIAMRVSQALRESGVKCEGINLFLADGEVAGQEIFHVHMHVIPRFKGDGFGIRFGPNYDARSERRKLDSIAKKTKRKLR
jgi:histidine triad (HIT) family protein